MILQQPLQSLPGAIRIARQHDLVLRAPELGHLRHDRFIDVRILRALGGEVARAVDPEIEDRGAFRLVKRRDLMKRSFDDAPLPLVAAEIEGWRCQRTVAAGLGRLGARSEEHTSELQSLMRPSYAVFC